MLTPPSPSKCLDPLLYIQNDQIDHIQPIIDNCYLPCSSVFVKGPRDLQTLWVAIVLFSIAMALSCLFALVYIIRRSRTGNNDIFTFSLKMMFTSALLFNLLIACSSWRSETCKGALRSKFSTYAIYLEFLNSFSEDIGWWCWTQRLLLNCLVVVMLEWKVFLVYTICFIKQA